MKTLNFILKDTDGSTIFDFSHIKVKNPIFFEKQIKKWLNASILYNTFIFANIDNNRIDPLYYLEYMIDTPNNPISNTIFSYLEPEFIYTEPQKQELFRINCCFLDLSTSGHTWRVSNDGYIQIPPEFMQFSEICKKFFLNYDRGNAESSLMDMNLANNIGVDNFFQLVYRDFYSEIEQLKQIIREHPDWETVWEALVELHLLAPNFYETIALAKNIVLYSFRTPFQKSAAWQLWVKQDKEDALRWLQQCKEKIDPELLMLIH